VVDVCWGGGGGGNTCITVADARGGAGGGGGNNYTCISTADGFGTLPVYRQDMPFSEIKSTKIVAQDL
jgi:hypothetical protein